MGRKLAKRRGGRVKARQNVIGFDPGGKQFGWCHMSVSDGNVRLHGFGTIFPKESEFEFEGGGMPMIRLTDGINQLFNSVKKPFVAYELIHFHKSTKAAQTYGWVRGKIMEECEIRNIPYAGFAPSTVRMHVMGNGKAKKEQVKRVLQSTFKVKFDNDDESDAVACALAFMIKQGWIDGQKT